MCGSGSQLARIDNALLSPSPAREETSPFSSTFPLPIYPLLFLPPSHDFKFRRPRDHPWPRQARNPQLETRTPSSDLAVEAGSRTFRPVPVHAPRRCCPEPAKPLDRVSATGVRICTSCVSGVAPRTDPPRSCLGSKGRKRVLKSGHRRCSRPSPDPPRPPSAANFCAEVSDRLGTDPSICRRWQPRRPAPRSRFSPPDPSHFGETGARWLRVTGRR